MQTEAGFLRRFLLPGLSASQLPMHPAPIIHTARCACPDLMPTATLPQEPLGPWALPPQLTYPVQGPNADLGGHQGHGGVRGSKLHAFPQQ